MTVFTDPLPRNDAALVCADYNYQPVRIITDQVKMFAFCYREDRGLRFLAHFGFANAIDLAALRLVCDLERKFR